VHNFVVVELVGSSNFPTLTQIKMNAREKFISEKVFFGLSLVTIKRNKSKIQEIPVRLFLFKHAPDEHLK